MKKEDILIVGGIALFVGIICGGYIGIIHTETHDKNYIDKSFKLNYTGYVSEIEFIYPYIMVIKFDEGHKLAFEHYNLQVPEQENITFIYHEGYMFDSKNPIYILDDFTVNV